MDVMPCCWPTSDDCSCPLSCVSIGATLRRLPEDAAGATGLHDLTQEQAARLCSNLPRIADLTPTERVDG